MDAMLCQDVNPKNMHLWLASMSISDTTKEERQGKNVGTVGHPQIMGSNARSRAPPDDGFEVLRKNQSSANSLECESHPYPAQPLDCFAVPLYRSSRRASKWCSTTNTNCSETRRIPTSRRESSDTPPISRLGREGGGQEKCDESVAMKKRGRLKMRSS